MRRRLRLPAQMSQCEVAKRFAVEVAAPLKLPELGRFEIELAVDEAFMNAADHGSELAPGKEIVLEGWIEKDSLVLSIKDFGGKPFNPSFFERMAQGPIYSRGGRGIRILKEILDEMMYIFVPGVSTTLYMVKHGGK